MDSELNYQEELERELHELEDVAFFLSNENVQKHIVKPFENELEQLKGSYDCDTLKDLYFTKGKKHGLVFLAEIIEGVNNRINVLHNSLMEMKD